MSRQPTAHIAGRQGTERTNTGEKNVATKKVNITTGRRTRQAPARDALIAEFLDHPAAREDVSVARLQPSYPMLIGGELVSAEGSRVFESRNPADGSVLTTIPHASTGDVDRAVAAARSAYPAWAALDGAARGALVFRLARRVAELARQLAVLETLDGGKPIRESRDLDIPLAAQHLFHHAGWADKLQHLGLGPDPRPHGVVAQIIPWNFPLLMCAWKIGPALAAGNTVVLKPAETTSITALVLASAAVDVGFPPGVLNVVTGFGDVGAALVGHPGVDKVAFTGSTEVGRFVARTAAERDIPATLELGGKSANILFRDADLRAAVEGVVDSIFFNQGHVCCAGSRLLVEESALEDVLPLLASRIAKIRVGDPMDKNTDLGAINSPEQLSKISAMVAAAIDNGAERLPVEFDLPSSGCYFAPTVLHGVDPADPIAREEVFGPVLTVLSFRTPDEAIELANDTPYGLASGVWSQRPERIFHVSSRLKAGVVWANTYNKFDPTAAFGGFRESGYGREGGRSGMEAYLVH
jgi:aldehyde dehydrogenase (NAD+)